MMCERNLSIDPSTIWRWVQRYAPELNKRIRRELKPTNGSWRTDETYVRVAGRWTYLYRAVDSTGATIDFSLSETRDLSSARRFFQKALAAPGHPRPRVINVDGNPSYPTVIEELKQKRVLGRRCHCRIVPYLNNIVEQDHRAESTLVWDYAPLLAHNSQFKATKQSTLLAKARFSGYQRQISPHKSGSSKSSLVSLLSYKQNWQAFRSPAAICNTSVLPLSN